ncbi:MAG: hypothetical protein JXD18_05475, partial [Anaerolineae bacterium]|nr:hypothetical protein [Anaerolineae bacterium]
MDEQQADVNQAALENTPQPVEAPANDTMMKIDGVKPSSGPTLRERLAATFGPARERLGPAFGRARGWLSTGNWIYVLITLLVIAALILPPISLPSRLGWVGFERVNAANAYSHPDGLLIGLDASGGNRPALAGTAGDVQGSIRINVTSVPRQIFIEGSAGDDLVAARDAIPPILELKSPYYQIESRSHDGELVRLEVAIPNEAEPWTTLDLYTWTGEAWEWVGGELDWSKEALVAYVADIPTSLAVMQTSPVVPAIETVTTASLPAGPAAQHLTHILIPGLFLGTDGILLGSAPAAAEGAPATLLLIRNWQEGQSASLAPTSDVLTDPDIQAAHIAIILDAATRARTAGIAIDYQGIAADQMDAFTAFVSALAGALHAQNMRLEVFLPTPAQLGDGAWDTAGYNWTALGFAADAVLMRLPDDPAAYVSRGAVESLLHWATAQVNRYKLRAVVSSLSVDSSPAGIEYVSLESALAPFGQVHMPADADPEPGDEVTFTLAGQVTSIQQDSAAATYAITYQDEGQAMHTTWLGTPSFLARKLDWALAYHLNGVVIENVLDDGNMAGIEEAIAGYRAAASLPQPTELNVIWTVAGPATAEQTVTLTQPDFSWTVPSTPGTYTVAVAIAGVNHGSVALNVANSNPTPTPTPSPTPAPQAEVEVEAGCLRASFVSDVTVPDGTHFDKGEAFTKTWRVRNSGTCDWPEGTVLVLNYSDFGGPETTTVGAVAVGETVDISIDLTAPDSNGNFDALWNLKVDGAEIPGGALTAVIQAGEIPSGPAVNVPTTIVPVA